MILIIDFQIAMQVEYPLKDKFTPVHKKPQKKISKTEQHKISFCFIDVHLIYFIKSANITSLICMTQNLYISYTFFLDNAYF